MVLSSDFHPVKSSTPQNPDAGFYFKRLKKKCNLCEEKFTLVMKVFVYFKKNVRNFQTS